MKLIKINKRSISEGCYGEYFRLSPRIGVKVLHDQGMLPSSIYALKKSDLYRNAQREFKLLKKVRKLGFVPKVHELVAVVVKGEDGIRPGIVMQHIEGTTYYDHENRYCSCDQCDPSYDLERLDIKLRKAGINHLDLGGGNAIYRKSGKLVAIDFTPENIRLDNRKLKRFLRKMR